jgi:hypothetical protein
MSAPRGYVIYFKSCYKQLLFINDHYRSQSSRSARPTSRTPSRAPKKKRKVSLLSACFFAVYLFTNSYLISPYPSASSHPPNLRRTASTNLQNQVNNEGIQSSSAPSPKDNSLEAEETRRLRLQNDLVEIEIMERKTRLEILRKERDLD